jgi:long-chain acyl-CoA synthetase
MAMSAGEEHIDLSLIEHRARSVAHLFVDRVGRTPAAEAFRFPRGGDWESVTWAQTDARVRRIAAGLVALGIESEQRVALASSTRYEWVIADLAVMLAGAATTTIYPTTSEPDVAHIVGDSESRIAFAEDDAQVAKLRANRTRLPDLVKVVTFDGTADGDWVISLADLEELGAALLAQAPSAVDDRIGAIEPQHLATLIYTSGTTGRPKGVRLSHDSWTYEAAAVDAIGILSQDDLQYLWLPLSHAFGKVLLILPLQLGFPTAVDGRVDKIVDKPDRRGADVHGWGSAHLREGLWPDHDHRERRGWGEGQAVRVGPSASAVRFPSCVPTGDRRPSCWLRSTFLRTGWSCRRSGNGSGAGSGSSSPDLQRSTAMWPSGSRQQACSSSRATD